MHYNDRPPHLLIPAFIDYETFWDVGYSLRQQKISTTDYIHDDRFAIHGASVALERNDPQWLQGNDLNNWIKQAKEDNCLLVGHHMLFDGYVTTNRIGEEFNHYFCTLAMLDALFQGAVGRGLDEAMTFLLGWAEGKTDILDRTKGKYWHQFTAAEKHDMEHYANQDLRGTQELFYKFGPQLPHSEWEIMSAVLRMFCHPRLEFDSDLLQVALTDAQNDRDENIEAALITFGCTEKDLSGNNAFAALVESCGIEMPMKPSPSKEGKMIPALAKTDQGFQHLLEHDKPEIAALAQGRLAVKSTQGITRAQRFIDLDTAIGQFPVAYNYYRAHTGRLSGANKVNAANLKNGSNLRKAIIAPDGYLLGVADSGQIECRDVGYLAGQDSQTELFRRKEDPYNDMAGDIFNRIVDRKGNPEEDYVPGFIGKTARLGLGFGMGGPKFKWTCVTQAKVRLGLDIDMPMEEANRIVYNVYRPKHWKIVEFWAFLQEALHRMVVNDPTFWWEYPDGALRFEPKENKVYFPNGTFLFYPLLSFDDGNFTYVSRLGKNYVNKKIYGGLFCENIVQKHARDIVAWQMLKLAQRFEVVMHTYDENVVLLPEATAKKDMLWVIDVMETAPPEAASLPLEADGGISREYSK